MPIRILSTVLRTKTEKPYIKQKSDFHNGVAFFVFIIVDFDFAQSTVGFARVQPCLALTA